MSRNGTVAMAWKDRGTFLALSNFLDPRGRTTYRKRKAMYNKRTRTTEVKVLRKTIPTLAWVCSLSSECYQSHLYSCNSGTVSTIMEWTM